MINIKIYKITCLDVYKKDIFVINFLSENLNISL